LGRIIHRLPTTQIVEAGLPDRLPSSRNGNGGGAAPAYLLDLWHRVDGVRGHRRCGDRSVLRVLKVEGHGEVGRGGSRGGGVGELRGSRDGLRRHRRGLGWADGLDGTEARARGAAAGSRVVGAGADGGRRDSPVRSLRLRKCGLAVEYRRRVGRKRVERSGAARTKADIRGNRICWAGLGWAWTKS
jgi:hypothetical protein